MSNSPIHIPIFGEEFTINPPVSFSIPFPFFGIGSFDIHYYAVIVTLGFVLAGVYLYARREVFGLTTNNVLDLLFLAVFFGIIGARIYFVIFNPSRYFGAGNWSNIFRLRSGGLAIYGGIIAAGLSIVIYAVKNKLPLGKIMDAAAFGVIIGQIIGRWGNFINREAYGVITDLPWRMGIATPQGLQYVHPIFLYESLWNFVGFISLHAFSKKQKPGFPGQLCLMYIAWYGFGRFFIEGIRGPDALLLHGTSLPVSQLLAAVSCILAIAFIAFFKFKYRNPDLDVEDLILEHSGEDYDEDFDDIEDEPIIEVIDAKSLRKTRAILAAKGRRSVKEKCIEDAKQSEKVKKFVEYKRTKAKRFYSSI